MRFFPWLARKGARPKKDGKDAWVVVESTVPVKEDLVVLTDPSSGEEHIVDDPYAGEGYDFTTESDGPERKYWAIVVGASQLQEAASEDSLPFVENSWGELGIFKANVEVSFQQAQSGGGVAASADCIHDAEAAEPLEPTGQASYSYSNINN